jgi:hypothetical protein
MIDDARLFNGASDYPTVERVRSLVAQFRPSTAVDVTGDIIRIHPV